MIDKSEANANFKSVKKWTLLCAIVRTASHQHGLETCTVQCRCGPTKNKVCDVCILQHCVVHSWNVYSFSATHTA
jgi:hypothetical protein